MLPKPPLPLNGFRVADITVVAAGTNAAAILADWGAEVVRVEPINVMQTSTRGPRAYPPKAMIDANRGPWLAYPNWTPGERPFNQYVIFHAHGRNKLSMTVDMSQPEGQATFRKLISISDVFLENNVPETIEKLGVDYPEMRKLRPDLVMCRMPAYGLSGSRKNYRSMGPHLEGTTGHTYIRGYPDLDPSNNEDTYIGDTAAAVSAAFAVALALRDRQRNGSGRVIELAQVENLLPFFGELLLDSEMNNRSAQPSGNDLFTMAPHNAYQCLGEDRWIAIAVSNDEEWRGLVQSMGNPEWTRDSRFATQGSRYDHRRELDELVTKWTLQNDNRSAMESLQANGVPAGVLNDDHDILSDPQFVARGFFEKLEAWDTGLNKYPGVVWKMARTPNGLRSGPPGLGQHNEWVYRDLLGCSLETYSDLEEKGQIATKYHAGIP